MANISELLGADIEDVREGIGHDRRVGFDLLRAGVGYGGSCFLKEQSTAMNVNMLTAIGMPLVTRMPWSR